MKLILKGILAILILGLSLSNCSKSNSSGGGGTNNNQADADGIAAVLVVPGTNIVSGDMPIGTGNEIEIIMVDSTVSYSAGSQVRLPIQFNSLTRTAICGVRFQVVGAGSYFDMTVDANEISEGILLPIGLPANLNAGSFCISITLYDCSGNSSLAFATCITVSQTMGCDVTRVSGGEGLTSTLHDMGDNPGNVIIEYDTYTVPDRIDIFYNGDWVAGTGPNPGSMGAIPPLADCANPTEGYIGEQGEVCFNFDVSSIQQRHQKLPQKRSTEEYPDLGLDSPNYVEVVVSGCVRGGTEWEYTISCADPTADCFAGQSGDPRFNLIFTGNVDFDLHVIDPQGEEIDYTHKYSESGGVLDVDCIACEHGTENIYWISGTAPSGQYEYWIHFYGTGMDTISDYELNIIKNGQILETKTGNMTIVDSETQHWFYTY